MANEIFLLLAVLTASLVLDATVRPRARLLRSGRGMLLHALAVTMTFGLCLALSGSLAVSGGLASALTALFTIASNVKSRMLGEPLVFSDLALIVGIVRHPHFYFTAIPPRQRMILAIGAIVGLVTVLSLFSARLHDHLVGAVLLALAGGALIALSRVGTFTAMARTPDLAADVARHGLLATLLLYWWRWQETRDPQSSQTLDQAADDAPEIVVIVQCESFADPVEMTGNIRYALPGLAAARAAAWQWGNLDVSGFGAYTMRTEYGVLFGRGEAALGFRRYDPYLTALGEASYALPTRLSRAGYRCSFVHPYDLRFYSRDRLMPQLGFEAVVGAAGFAPLPSDAGRYVDDRTLGAALLQRVAQAAGPTLIYAVTMENHGPWDDANAPPGSTPLDAYLRGARSSDGMLRDLVAQLSHDGRPALLVFFGDHRPSVPGVTAPGGPRHTPYVMLRFGRGAPIPAGAAERSDLSPAELHHAILRCVRSGADPSNRVDAASDGEQAG